MFATTFTNNTNCLFVSISSKATGIIQNSSNSLCWLHFIEHRTLYLTSYSHQRFIRVNYNYISFLKTDIIFHLTLHKVIINIQISNRFTIANYLNTTQTTNFINTASTIQSMENRGKRG